MNTARTRMRHSCVLQGGVLLRPRLVAMCLSSSICRTASLLVKCRTRTQYPDEMSCSLRKKNDHFSFKVVLIRTKPAPELHTSVWINVGFPCAASLTRRAERGRGVRTDAEERGRGSGWLEFRPHRRQNNSVTAETFKGLKSSGAGVPARRCPIALRVSLCRRSGGCP